MRKVVVLAVALVACNSNADKVEELEKKVAKLEKQLDRSRDEVEELEKKLERSKETKSDLEKKIDDLQRKTRDLARPSYVPPARARPPEPDPAKTYAVPLDQAIFEGPADAKITIVRAFDYACPFCERSRATMAELRKKYGDDLRIAYQHLVVHPTTAMAGALAACAADRQHAFAKIDEMLWEKGFKARNYDTGTCWESPDGCPVVLGFARDAGLDAMKFKMDMRLCESTVKAQMASFRNFGVNATPTFFVNGRFIPGGAVPIDNFVRVIDEELAKANAKIAAGTPKRDYYQRWVMDVGLPRLEPATAGVLGANPLSP